MGGAISALGRSLVPWHPATAWALLASLAILITAGTSHGWQSGLRGAAVALIAWAIVRELAPRRAPASLLAPCAAVACAIPAEADLLAGLIALLAARIAARSTGIAPTRLDIVILLALTGLGAMRPGALPTVLVLAGAITADAPPRRQRVLGIGLLALALVVGSVEGTLSMRPEWTSLPPQGMVLLALVGAAAVWLLVVPLPRVLAVRDDRDLGPLLGPRVRSARVVTAASVIAATLWSGTDGPFVAASASAALLAAGLGGAWLRGRPASEASGTMQA